jgi:hypothetical protein
MNEPVVRPEAVETATAWLRERGTGVTREVLTDALRASGYTELEIAAAFARVDAGAGDATGIGRDLRGRAAAILIVAFLGTWLVLAAILVSPSDTSYEFGGLAALILGAILGVMLLLSLALVSVSGRLRQGIEGALVLVLAVPFVLLFVVAGLCVVSTNGLRV